MATPCMSITAAMLQPANAHSYACMDAFSPAEGRGSQEKGQGGGDWALAAADQARQPRGAQAWPTATPRSRRDWDSVSRAITMHALRQGNRECARHEACQILRHMHPVSMNPPLARRAY